MRIRIADIDETVRELTFEESLEDLNALFQRRGGQDYRFECSASVRVQYYRGGEDLFISGRSVSGIVGQCARCLESYDFRLDAPFAYMLSPRSTPESEDEDDDLELAHYEGDDVDLSPLVTERIILALPTQPLCRDDCKGLCPQCGADQNREPCDCRAEVGDPRLAVLRQLRIRK